LINLREEWQGVMRGDENEAGAGGEGIQGSQDHTVPNGVRHCTHVQRRVVILVVKETTGARLTGRVRKRNVLHALNVTSSVYIRYRSCMGAELTDLRDRDDVQRLVSEFYRRAFIDDLLGPIFTYIANMDFDHHLPIICDFWETVLFRAGLYQRNALAIHMSLNAKVPLGAEHFDRWLALWSSTVDEHFAGEKAELAKVQAGRIAGSIHRRLQGHSGSDFETIGAREGASPI
jgi:hemoglobin